ncbi:MAG: hypothetical protein JST45_14775 [Bacteroidetes bacterium]|nr:hypothetical protein [Bacteroidota bacterium]
MSLSIYEWFGYALGDSSNQAKNGRLEKACPFVGGICTKVLGRSKLISGVCSVKPATSGPVVCCPNRMYANEYHVLLDVAEDAFGPGVRLCRSERHMRHDGKDVVVFGKRWGKELRLASRHAGGGYFVDWVLALVDGTGKLLEFVAAEVQTMDTTGSYEPAVRILYEGGPPPGPSKAGINWENVNKRILPQLIFKGHVIRLEEKCRKGLYFICPEPVYRRMAERLGGDLVSYPPQPGALTFLWYGLGPADAGKPASLKFAGKLTTTVDQVALAFTSPRNLPVPGGYEKAISAALSGG